MSFFTLVVMTGVVAGAITLVLLALPTEGPIAKFVDFMSTLYVVVVVILAMIAMY